MDRQMRTHRMENITSSISIINVVGKMHERGCWYSVKFVINR